jgi:hypothetical protein
MNAITKIQLRRVGFIEVRLRDALSIPTSQDQVTTTARCRR